jgi:hypothetical protein
MIVDFRLPFQIAIYSHLSILVFFGRILCGSVEMKGNFLAYQNTSAANASNLIASIKQL